MGRVTTPEVRLRAVVARLLDDPAAGARLLSMGEASAVVVTEDRRLVALCSPALGSSAAIAGKFHALLDANPGVPVDLVVIGGDEDLRARLPRGGVGLSSKRSVRVLHLAPKRGASEWALWTEGGVRPDSQVAMALRSVAGGGVPPIELPALMARVDKPPPLTDEQRAEQLERQAFIARLRGRPLASYALVAVFLLLFGLEELWGGSESLYTLVRMGANDRTTLAGEPWRLLSSAVLHGGLLHVLVNSFVLVVLGGFVEKLLGVARYGVLLGVAAIGGSLASALMPPDAVSVGASGAIWGVLGGAAAIAWRPGTLIPRAMVRPLRRNAAINLLINLSISFIPQVDLWAHLGGGIAGAALVLSGVLTRGLGDATPAAGEHPPADRAQTQRSTPGGEGRDLSPPRRTQLGIARGWVIAASATAVLTVACVAMAWVQMRPWDNTAVLRWQTHSLGGLVIEVPRSLGAPVEGAGVTEQEQVWSFGDLERQPLSLSLIMEPYDLSDQEREALAQRYAAQRYPLPEGVEIVTPWHRRPGDGPPSFEVAFRHAGGAVEAHWRQLRPGALVQVQSVRWGDQPWSTALERVYASLER